jgi:hypothetical protein
MWFIIFIFTIFAHAKASDVENKSDRDSFCSVFEGNSFKTCAGSDGEEYNEGRDDQIGNFSDGISDISNEEIDQNNLRGFLPPSRDSEGRGADFWDEERRKKEEEDQRRSLVQDNMARHGAWRGVLPHEVHGVLWDLEGLCSHAIRRHGILADDAFLMSRNEENLVKKGLPMRNATCFSNESAFGLAVTAAAEVNGPFMDNGRNIIVSIDLPFSVNARNSILGGTPIDYMATRATVIFENSNGQPGKIITAYPLPL